jgi:hypothetical protein
VGRRWQEKAFQRLAKHLPGPAFRTSQSGSTFSLGPSYSVPVSTFYVWRHMRGWTRGDSGANVTAPLEILMPIGLSDLHMEPGLAGESTENRSLPTGVRLIP